MCPHYKLIKRFHAKCTSNTILTLVVKHKFMLGHLLCIALYINHTVHVQTLKNYGGTFDLTVSPIPMRNVLWVICDKLQHHLAADVTRCNY